MFTSDMILDATLIPAMLVALVAGLLSFLSPCVLPIVPPYLAYMGGVSVGEMAEERSARRRTLLAAGFFVLGLSTVFLLLGAAASAFGRALLQWQGWFVPLAGVVIMVFGAHFLGVLRIPFLAREARLDAGDRGGSALGAYVLGLAFAFGWTPCIGPVLAAILFLAGAEDSAGQGAFLLMVYSLGLGVPFLLAAAFAPAFLGWASGFRRHLPTVEKAMGSLLVVTGVLFITGQMSAMSYWLLETFPALATIG